MPSTIAEVDKLFAAGAESVTLTRAEWEGVQEVSKGYFANGLQVSNAKDEMERVKRIARPLWRACKAVSRQMQMAMSGRRENNVVTVSYSRMQDWEMRLRHATQVSWRDLPAGHRLQQQDWR